MILASHIPAAMLFLRTPAGLSHHPDEAVALADVDAAIKTCIALLDTLKP
jgi:allantoate deiminase